MYRTPFTFCLAIILLCMCGNPIATAEENTQTLESLLAEARMAQSRGDYSQASAEYRKAAALDPSIPELWANLGLMEHQAGRISEAMKSFQQAAHLKPSLFVPQLFLGLEYLQSKNAKAALPHLENAVRLNPKDVQAVRSLGKTYAMLNQSENATAQYLREVELAPDQGDAWLDLGTAYLQQVENDARLMTSSYDRSAYEKLRSAEVLADEDKLIEAERAYKTAVASVPPVPCSFAEYGITLLREQKVAAAREQFEHESQAGTHCGLAALGSAVADAASGNTEAALSRLGAIASSDSGFVRSFLPQFRGALSTEQLKALIDAARTVQSASASVQLDTLIEDALLAEEAPPLPNRAQGREQSHGEAQSFGDAERFYASGEYSACGESLEPLLPKLDWNQLQLVALCSFYGADFQTTSQAAQQLERKTETRAQGLYWESKADQRLAIAALVRAGEIDANSPRMHVLLGDVFREKRRWDEAETEYRKAVALDSKSHGARLSLAITLFSELKNDEAFSIDQSLLAEDGSDPEANLLASEILVQSNQFSQAEPYLLKCANLNPELIPRYHALLGRVYGETNRIQAAIAEYKLGLSTDEDGSIHYQLARLYQKSGNKVGADETFKEAKRLVDRRNDRARLVLEQSGTDVSRQ